ncbi:alpha/beta hydrolase [Phyllobacterium sp. SB3]|uniref:RBBP9/YdeN family alpha/beta hydrolase n=1 Tax=Phyllobacterium sp. SB3 TaxID=3156073 RepID=UPI0032AFD47D
MDDIIMLPGSGGSGPTHWQTLWQEKNEGISRFAPNSWDQVELDDWIRALDRAVEATARPPVLVAHSLSCLLVSYWAARTNHTVAGAFLVAVPDPQSAAYQAEDASLAGFTNPPIAPLPFPALILASDNDPFGSMEYANMRSQQWHAPLINVGSVGHINSASNLGAWPQGWALLTAFRAGIAHH